MKTQRIVLTLSLILLLAGCATTYTAVVTLTSVVRTAMRAWAEAAEKGLTTPLIDSKVAEVHKRYRQAAATAQDALKAYKETGDQAEYIRAFGVVRSVASELISLIAPLITPDKAVKIQADLNKAVTL